ncbi:hypothetical protein ABZW11_45540, partial [Nonomuraea sp. NPDC004580]|uniref:hypothetical protein n=1 Tax=Nonomuraea sp. NPDC004580 TaxID=3154552 RepID=UPI0033B321B3
SEPPSASQRPAQHRRHLAELPLRHLGRQQRLRLPVGLPVGALVGAPLRPSLWLSLGSPLESMAGVAIGRGLRADSGRRPRASSSYGNVSGSSVGELPGTPISTPATASCSTPASNAETPSTRRRRAPAGPGRSLSMAYAFVP